MSHTDLRDFHCEYREVFSVVRDGEPTTFIVEIEKLGGGTVGKRYPGDEYWRYIVKRGDGEEIARGQDLRMGAPSMHTYVAKTVFGWKCGSITDKT